MARSLYNWAVLRLPESMKSTPDQDRKWSILDLKFDHFLLAESIRSGAQLVGAYDTYSEAVRVYDECCAPSWMGAIK